MTKLFPDCLARLEGEEFGEPYYLQADSTNPPKHRAPQVHQQNAFKQQFKEM